MPPLPPHFPDRDLPGSRDPLLRDRPALAPEEAGYSSRRGPLKDPGSAFSRAVAWFAATLMVVAVVWLQASGRAAGDEHPEGIPPPDLQQVLLSRMAMGVQALASKAPGGMPNADEQGAELLRQFDEATSHGPIRNRVRAAVLAAELASPDAALSRLDEAERALATLEQQIDDGALDDPDAADRERARIVALRRDIEALRTIYTSPDVHAAGLDADQRRDLRERHGYLGDVALAFGLDDAGPERSGVLADGLRTMAVLVGAFIVIVAALLTGFVLFVIAIVKLSSPRGLARGYAPPAFGGSVYMEVLTLFLGGFIVVSVIAGLLSKVTSAPVEYLLVWLLALVPLWPLLRGQRWAAHRHALGWTRGRGIAREMLAGVVGYLAMLPIFVLGVLCTVALSILWSFIEQLRGGEEPPPMSHPVMDQLVGGDLTTLLVLLSLAAVWAPLVEETIFRGAFFHHLRGRWGAVGAAAVSGFVFAVIHPQGFATIPALMSLGFCFAMLREWRGSLIAPITAHAMHNGFLVTMLWLALS